MRLTGPVQAWDLPVVEALDVIERLPGWSDDRVEWAGFRFFGTSAYGPMEKATIYAYPAASPDAVRGDRHGVLRDRCPASSAGHRCGGRTPRGSCGGHGASDLDPRPGTVGLVDRLQHRARPDVAPCSAGAECAGRVRSAVWWPDARAEPDPWRLTAHDSSSGVPDRRMSRRVAARWSRVDRLHDKEGDTDDGRSGARRTGTAHGGTG